MLAGDAAAQLLVPWPELSAISAARVRARLRLVVGVPALVARAAGHEARKCGQRAVNALSCGLINMQPLFVKKKEVIAHQYNLFIVVHQHCLVLTFSFSRYTTVHSRTDNNNNNERLSAHHSWSLCALR